MKDFNPSQRIENFLKLCEDLAKNEENDPETVDLGLRLISAFKETIAILEENCLLSEYEDYLADFLEGKE